MKLDVVAMAAPVNPNAGIGPKPFMNSGQKIILQMLATHKLFIEIEGSPAPLKIPLIKNNNMITRLPAIIMRI